MKEGKLCWELELALSLFPYHSQISPFLLEHFTAVKLGYYCVKKGKRAAVELMAKLFAAQYFCNYEGEKICEEILICI